MTVFTNLQSELEISKKLTLARLPAMPQILLQLNQHCRSETVEMAVLADLIAKDAALTSRIITVANNQSPRKGQFVSLEQSLIALGVETVKMLLVHESAFAVFDHSALPDKRQLHEFWEHSLSAAITAQMIALHIGYPNIEEAYLGGLLHDIGRLALLMAAPEECAAASYALHEDVSGTTEQGIMQMTHCQAGAWLIERWHLDSFLADSVLYHHEPAGRIDKAHLLIRIVHMANMLSQPDAVTEVTDPESLLLDIKPADLQAIRQRTSELVQKAAEQLGIGLDDERNTPQADPPAAAMPIVPPGTAQLLADQMRCLMLVSEAAKSFGRQDGIPGLLEAIVHAARLLFNLDDAIILLIDDTGLAMKGTGMGEHRRRLAQFSVPLNSSGAIARAIQRKHFSLISGSTEAIGIVEEQLFRMMGTECLICLPLSSADHCIGTLIGATTTWKSSALRQQQDFLQVFAVQAATAIRSSLSEHSQSKRQFATATEEYRQASRRLAHEVNNPLSLIKNYLHVLDRKLAKQEAANLEMSILHEEIDRISQIINEFADLHLGKRNTGTEVSDVINDVVRLFRETEYVPSTVQIISRMQEQAYEVNISADSLKQILVNLFKNAVEALPNGGLIEIKNNGLANRDGQLYVEIWLRDTGPGIPPEVMSHLFSPVKSTKGAGHRGLGLSIVYGLVKDSKGLITCRSGNEGTTFELLIPAVIPGNAQPGMEVQARHMI